MSPIRSVLAPLALGLLFSAPPTFAAPAGDAPSWRGAAPLSGVPDRAEILAAREACREAKEAAVGARLRDGSRTEDPREDYDALYYSLELGMYQGGSSLDGQVTMRAASLVDDLGQLVLDAASNVSVSAVRVDGSPVAFAHEGESLTVDLDAPLGAGQTVEVEIDYSATFTGGGVLSVWRTNVQTNQQIHTLTTQSEPYDARRWWPCKDDTRDKADSLRITVTTDDFNTVVCNGVLEADVDNGDGTRSVTWFERWPIVTYLASVCVTEYNHQETVWDWNDTSMPMHDWSWSLSTADQQYVMQAGLYGLTALSDRYGLYPYADEKYGHAQYTWGGAMEHQSCSSMGFYNESVIAHELSHQWFGDKVTCDTFHDIWLNEGWATYSEAIYFEYYLGEDALHTYMEGERYLGPGTIYVENPYTDVIFDGNLSYSKGGWTVHMLRHVMGEEAFWNAVHAYLGDDDRANYRTATTDQFREFMEAEHGEDLSWFFDEWIHGEYWPDYAYAWSQQTVEDETLLTVQVVQRQAPERQTFTMPVDLRVKYMDGSTDDFSLFSDRVAQTFELTLSAEADSVFLDPDQWILGQVELLANPPETAIVIESVDLLDGAQEPAEAIPAGADFFVRVRASNAGGDAEAFEAELSVDLDGVTLDDPLQTVGTLPFGGSVDLLFAGSGAGDLSGMAGFELALRWTGGETGQAFVLPAGQPQLLLVDDDGGDTYESWYETALEGRVHYETIPADELPASLAPWDLVVWFTGDAERELSGAEWDRAMQYVNLDAGHLVFTGRHFAGSQDPLELSGRVGIEVLDSEYNSNAVYGAGFFDDEVWYLFNGGAGNQQDMDALNGMLDCMSPAAYYNGQTEGSAGEELWCGDGGVIVLGFGLEGVAPVGNGLRLSETLESLLDWAHGETAVEPAPEAGQPSSLEVLGAWPNPFNPSTRIAWSSPQAGRLRLTVHNIAGQRVESRELAVGAGRGELVFDGSRLASGLYVARLELEGEGDRPQGAATVKLMLLK